MVYERRKGESVGAVIPALLAGSNEVGDVAAYEDQGPVHNQRGGRSGHGRYSFLAGPVEGRPGLYALAGVMCCVEFHSQVIQQRCEHETLVLVGAN